jgi:type IX secretion system PorP/SprF family membrane protein
MRNKKIFKVFLFAAAIQFIAVVDAAAQEQSLVSQYMFNMLNVNPAYAGNREVGNLNLLIRNQWVSMPGAPVFGSLSYDARKENSNVGLGVQVYSNRIGIEKTTGANGIYSYRVPFKKSYLSIGMSFGILNYQANFTQSNAFQTGDPTLQQNVNGFLPAAGFGMLYAREKWYIGLSSPSLLSTRLNAQGKADVSSAGKNSHYFLNTGYVVDASDFVKVKPSVLVKVVSGAPVQYDLNVNTWFGGFFGAGLSYRTEDAILGMLELQLTPQLRMGYAYDYSNARLVNYNRGSHEFMLRYEFGSKLEGRAASPRYY